MEEKEKKWRLEQNTKQMKFLTLLLFILFV